MPTGRPRLVLEHQKGHSKSSSSCHCPLHNGTLSITATRLYITTTPPSYHAGDLNIMQPFSLFTYFLFHIVTITFPIQVGQCFELSFGCEPIQYLELKEHHIECMELGSPYTVRMCLVGGSAVPLPPNILPPKKSLGRQAENSWPNSGFLQLDAATVGAFSHPQPEREIHPSAVYRVNGGIF